MLQLYKLSYSNRVEIVFGWALAFYEVANGIVVVGVVEPPLRKSTGLIPDDFGSESQKRAVVNKVDASGFPNK